MQDSTLASILLRPFPAVLQTARFGCVDDGVKSPVNAVHRVYIKTANDRTFEGGAAGGHDSSLATEKGDGHGHRPQSFLLCTRPSLGAHPRVIVTGGEPYRQSNWRLDLLIKLCYMPI